MRAEILFPEVCNLYGDLQNVYYLRRCCPSLEIVETDLHSRPRFLDGEVTLVFMGSTTEQGLRLAADALRPYAADIAARARYQMMKRHNSFFLGSFEDMDVVGFKSLFGHSYDAPERDGWFRVTRGVGRNPDTPLEGYRRGGLMATYLIGPLLILNPPLCKWLLRRMNAPSDALAFEEAAMASYEKRVAEFRQESRNYLY